MLGAPDAPLEDDMRHVKFIPMYIVAFVAIVNLGKAYDAWGITHLAVPRLIYGVILWGAAVWGCLEIGWLESRMPRSWTSAQLQADSDRAARLRCDVQERRYSAPAIQAAIQDDPRKFWNDTCVEFWKDVHEPLLHDARLFAVVTSCSIGIRLLERSLRQKRDSGHMLLARIIKGRGLTPLADGEQPEFYY